MWKKSVCALHSPQFKEDCPCCVPYGVHRFPGRAEDEDIRKMWIKNVHRKDFAPKQVFKGMYFYFQVVSVVKYCKPVSM